MTRLRGALVLLLVLPVGAGAQPDPRQMSGIPLPDAELNDGTVSVRVIRGQLSNNVPNQVVELRSGDIVEEATTDAEGRATFATLNPGQQVQAATELDGERIESLPFAAPGRGGVRLMLVGADPDRPVEPAPPGLVTFGGESFIQVEIVEESVEVYYVFDVNNPAQVAVEASRPGGDGAAARGARRDGAARILTPDLRRRPQRGAVRSVRSGRDAAAHRLHPAVLG